MKFHILTIFPEVFDPYLDTSIMKRAREKGLVDFNIVDLRDFTDDKRRTVDDTPFGGGAGMIMMIEPIYRAIAQVKSLKLTRPNDCSVGREVKSSRIILLSAKGERFTQEKARELSGMDNIVLICGRYEGVDERVAEHIADEEISIGDYVLTGGEIPAMAVSDVITRLIPGVIAEESLKEESFNKVKSSLPNGGQAKLTRPNDCSVGREVKSYGTIEYPQYTRPAVFKTDNGEEWKVPEILLSGNHEEIRKWRLDKSIGKNYIKSNNNN